MFGFGYTHTYLVCWLTELQNQEYACLVTEVTIVGTCIFFVSFC